MKLTLLKQLLESIKHEIDDKLLKDYLHTALWAESNPDTDKPFDDDYKVDDFSKKTLDRSKKELTAFFIAANDLGLLDGLDSKQVVHDFWLTRNRHGAGFWDRKYKNGKEVGEKLTALAHTFREVGIVVGDDGKLHIE